MRESASQVLTRVRRKVFDRPPPITVADWSDRYAYFVRDKQPVKYDWRQTPYAWGIFQAIHRKGIRRVTFKKPEQVGGTEILYRILGWAIDRRPGRGLIVYPNMGIGVRQNREKLIPSIEATPCLRERLARHGRAKKNKAIDFDRMTLTFAGAPQNKKIDANVEGFDYSLVIVDELDRCNQDVIGTVMGRGKTRANFLLIDNGTPDMVGSGIDAAYAESDQARYYVPCPHEKCREYHVRDFAQVRWPGVTKKGEWSECSRDVQADPDDVKHTAYMVCPHCRGNIYAASNFTQLSRGVWLTKGRTIGKWSGTWDDFTPGEIAGEESRSNHAGFWITGLYSSIPNDINPYGYVAEGYVRAKGHPDRHWVNRRLGEAFQNKGDTIEYKDAKSLCIAEKDGGYRLGTIPKDVLVLVATADLQKDAAYVEIDGYAANGAWCCLVWCGRVPWMPGTPGEALDVAIDRVFTRSDGAKFRAVAEAVDEGDGNRTEEVWARARRRLRMGRPSYTVKGVGDVAAIANMHGPHTFAWIDKLPDGSPDTRGPRRLRINSFVWKSAVHRAIRRTAIQDADESETLDAIDSITGFSSGKFKLPADTPEDYLRQITAEHCTSIKRGPNYVQAFRLRPGQVDNHYFDTRVYNHALADALQVRYLTREAGVVGTIPVASGSTVQRPQPRPAQQAPNELLQRARERAGIR